MTDGLAADLTEAQQAHLVEIDQAGGIRRFTDGRTTQSLEALKDAALVELYTEADGSVIATFTVEGTAEAAAIRSDS